jgi:hypothetical protein
MAAAAYLLTPLYAWMAGEVLKSRIRSVNDVLAARGSLEVSFRETSAWLGTTAI